MDAELLARIQFALTIMFHYIFPPLSIGLGVVLVAIETAWLRTRNTEYLLACKFWTKVFALTFSMGVATGIVMEFEFGTNWATYSRYVGDVFGSALAAEGIFAFFLESGFLAILLFGWDRVKPALHWFATLMVCLGAHFSAVWIVVANSWMQTPAGFKIAGEGLSARAEITDFWAMVFNPSSVARLSHTIVGAWLAGAFLIISVAAYYLLKGRHRNFSRISMKVGLSIATVALILQAVTGDLSARIVAAHQPTKLAAMEGVYETQRGAPLFLFGVPDSSNDTIRYGLSIPNLLSWLAFRDSNAEIAGLDQVPRNDWPNVPAVFTTFHLMLLMWVLMVIAVAAALYAWWKGTLLQQRTLLFYLVISVIWPQVANQAGWITAEMGRYPWIVQDLLRISDALSKAVTAEQILGSIIMFGVIYLMLGALFFYLLDHKIRVGPEEPDNTAPYHQLDHLLEESPDGTA